VIQRVFRYALLFFSPAALANQPEFWQQQKRSGGTISACQQPEFWLQQQQQKRSGAFWPERTSAGWAKQRATLCYFLASLKN
jgi:hypothetical protein